MREDDLRVRPDREDRVEVDEVGRILEDEPLPVSTLMIRELQLPSVVPVPS